MTQIQRVYARTKRHDRLVERINVLRETVRSQHGRSVKKRIQ